MKKTSIFSAFKTISSGISSKRLAIISASFFTVVALVNIKFLINVGKGTVLNVLLLSFGGPILKEFPAFTALQWFLTQLIIMSLLGSFSFFELYYRGIYTLTRIGSRIKWWTMIAVSLLIKIIQFYIVGIIVVFLISITQFPLYDEHLLIESMKLPITFNMLIILCVTIMITSFAITLLQSFLSIILKSTISPSIFILIIHIFAIYSANINFELVKWLPGNQSMIFRHSIFTSGLNSFSMIWSLTYNFFLISIILLYGYFVITRFDIFSSKED